MDLEWNEDKRRLNFAKHGVDFPDVANIFLGDVLERIDDRGEYGEVRIVATGVAGESMVTVVYTERGKYRRIISARKAHKNERREYRARFAGGPSTPRED